MCSHKTRILMKTQHQEYISVVKTIIPKCQKLKVILLTFWQLPLIVDNILNNDKQNVSDKERANAFLCTYFSHLWAWGLVKAYVSVHSCGNRLTAKLLYLYTMVGLFNNFEKTISFLRHPCKNDGHSRCKPLKKWRCGQQLRNRKRPHWWNTIRNVLKCGVSGK